MRRAIKWQKGAVIERLTNRKYGENSCAGVKIPYSTYCIGCITSGCNCGIVEDMVKKLADYENLEEQGRLIKLPCNVGDTVYAIGFNNNKQIIYESVVLRILITEKEIVFDVKVDEFGINSQLKQSILGKTVFFTKSEAEAKLKELRYDND